MPQIEVDFETYKALFSHFQSENDSFAEVIRRLLGLPASESELPFGVTEPSGLPIPAHNAMLGARSGGVWFSNIFFPDGSIFRATYKGKTYRARIQSSQWIDELGFVRTSPSDAASAISKTNVNGWRFWFVRRPGDEDWQRMDALKP